MVRCLQGVWIHRSGQRSPGRPSPRDCLRAGGYQTAYEGARVHCQVLKRPKGMQAFHILSMDESTAIHPSLLPQRTHVQVVAESDWERATVKWFNRVRGFGFLTRGEGTPDIFCHMETLRRFGFTELRPVRRFWCAGATARKALWLPNCVRTVRHRECRRPRTDGMRHEQATNFSKGCPRGGPRVFQRRDRSCRGERRTSVALSQRRGPRRNSIW